MELRELVKKLIYPIINFSYRRKLKTPNFTIISDNCWGGEGISRIRNILYVSFCWIIYI
ncbi:DUF1919 domain-containing protein [Actinobacillus equuli]|uniref:DUF1919 domain-containing protein n=1 Tax=Actinobacillus equuli TaxID=718 RepID=UPI003C6EC100